ncbi:hypothetical protein SMSP2_00891 [Limihaloglobus sulfuriphilus]|uniref:LamG-like jellyroll fold domain-containing protein n=1 Tax=Limihaloglobus sulfuriphilus TaxID=1851148 RepID=A0A1Q2MD09_9BACT|nr:LamG domain-containing protein [Limihaloglobus sulfuriphilus]AQQ70539.1 hypothetical protein SMSP2_00891 [Limihaloglobus sulfuriphilus]
MIKTIHIIVISLCICGMSAATSPVALQYLSFEDNFGNASLVDDAGGGVGSIDFINGPVGKAAEFTNPTAASQGDHLELSHSMAQEGSLSMYLNIDHNYDYQNVWDAGTGGWMWEMYNDSNAGKFYSKVGSWPGCALLIGQDFELGSWFHYTFTWKRNGDYVDCYVYVDGVLVDSQTGTAQQWTAPGSKFNAGGGLSGQYKFNGQMDELYIFDGVLSETDIAGLIANVESGSVATEPLPYVGCEVEEGNITLSWTAPTGIASPEYKVYVATESADFTGVAPITTSAPSTEITVESGKNYYWKVEVIDGASSYEAVVWSFKTAVAGDRLVAVSHIPFSDTSFGGATYIDDQLATSADGTITKPVAGEINIIEGGIAGSYGEFVNNGWWLRGGDSLAVANPGATGTVAMWARLDVDAVHQYYPLLWDSAPEGYNQAWKSYAFFDNNGVVEPYTVTTRVANDAWKVLTTPAVTKETWFHYAFSWNDKGNGTADIALYVDGSLVASKDNSAFTSMDSVIRIGGGGLSLGHAKWQGDMDEVYVFDSALNAEQVASLVASTSAGMLATDPSPQVGTVTMSETLGELNWQAPVNVASPRYNVYFGTTSDPGASELIESDLASTSVVVPAQIEVDTTYFWRVDVLDGANVNKGIVWSFTPEYLVGDINKDTFVNNEDIAMFSGYWQNSNLTEGSDWIVDDFESYATSQAMQTEWEVVPANYYSVYKDGDVTLDLQNNAEGNFLRYSYDLLGFGDEWGLAEFMYVFDTPKDLSQYDELEVMVNFAQGNSHEQYFTIKLFQGGVGCGGVTGEHRMDPAAYIVADPALTTDQATGWKVITADLSQYSDLTDIYGFEIGCSSAPFAAVDFDSGTIDFDNIKFIFVPECTGPVEGDINGDCVVDFQDLIVIVSNWLQ